MLDIQQLRSNLDAVAAGLAKRGKPIARLVPIAQEPPVVFGRLKGSARITGDIFSTGEAWDADA